MFITQGFKRDNEFWRYLLGSIVIIAFNMIGYIPLIAGLAIKSIGSGKAFPTENNALMTYLDPNLTLFLLLLSFAAALGGIYVVVRYFHRQTWREVTTGRPKLDWGRVFFSFGIWALFTIVTTVISYYANPENFVINFKPIPFAILALIGIIMIPIQTSTEEYVFRGYLMQGFALLAKNRWFPLVMTSLIFGMLHLSNPEVVKMGPVILIYYIGTGLFLGILTLMDDGLELSLGFHAANNLVGALLVTSDWSVFQTNSVLKDISEPTAGLDVIIPVVIIFPILLFIFSKKYNWTGWKEKLTGKIEISDKEVINEIV